MVWRQMCEGYYFDRRQRDAAVPHDPGGVQAAIAHLRQAANCIFRRDKATCTEK